MPVDVIAGKLGSQDGPPVAVLEVAAARATSLAGV